MSKVRSILAALFSNVEMSICYNYRYCYHPVTFIVSEKYAYFRK
nr:MAG TPA: hypothetical protein [Bacteriophage sp.]